jgi:hypothetical protein
MLILIIRFRLAADLTPTMTFITKVFLFFVTLVALTKVLGHRAVECIFKKKGGLATAHDCDFFGNDLNWYWAGTLEGCERTCAWYGDTCTHFVWDSWHHKCFLKSTTPYTTAGIPVFDRGLVSAIRCQLVRTKECRGLISQSRWVPKFYVGPPEKFLRSYGCYFNEEETHASFYNATLQQCVDECRRITSCTHYNFMAGYCDLFQGDVQASDVVQCTTTACHCGEFNFFKF